MRVRRPARLLFACAAVAFVGVISGAERAAAQTEEPANKSPAPPATKVLDASKLTDRLFLEMDKNHDGVITENEITEQYREKYGDLLKQADRNHDGRITREEWNRARELRPGAGKRMIAGCLLILAFAGFCFVLDGLLEPERREYLWLTSGGCVLLVGIAFLLARSWFFQEAPYLAFVGVAPLLLVLIAMLTGATKAKEVVPVVSGPVLYQAGSKPTATKPTTPGTAPQRPVQQPRKLGPPQRTPRPAPLPRPPVPERRPSSSPGTQPPRPPGSPPKPGPGGAKPPGKT